MQPTAEQQQALDLFKTGESLAIEAGAGTGKTSTLVMLAESAGPSTRGQYVAFNKALVTESGAKFPVSKVKCNTAHSLAYRNVGHKYARRLGNSQRIPSYQIAQRLGLRDLSLADFKGEQKVVRGATLAGWTMKSVEMFCQSDKPELLAAHVYRAIAPGLSDESNAYLMQELLPLARSVWEDLQGEYGWAPFKHSHYLKMWQLDDPVIGADYILFDEAQDANPVIASIIANQEEYSQLIYVGDSQQEIYAWTGAINALAKVQVKHRSFLTQSFRFGQAIADRANLTLDALRAELRLTGNPAIESRLEVLDKPKAVLVRTNATGLSNLMAYQKEGVAAHFIGGTDELLSFARAARELQGTGRTGHPDLVNFTSWSEVQEYVRDDEAGSELSLNVRLVDSYGVDAIEKAVTTMPYEGIAEVVISTAHRAKGREWLSVQLAGDFPRSGASDPADLRLLYVALTRAQEVLDSHHVDEQKGGWDDEEG